MVIMMGDEPDFIFIACFVQASMRQLLAKLSKLEYADVFMYPVDGDVYPEYYEVISNPIDISTIRNKINSYTSIEDFLKDLRQIWENCRLFNSDGSDIVKWASELAEATEGLVEVFQGFYYV